MHDVWSVSALMKIFSPLALYD